MRTMFLCSFPHGDLRYSSCIFRGFTSERSRWSASVRGIRDVAGRDQQKFVRSVEQQKRVHEIRVLGYYYPQITGGQFVDLRVGGAIGIRQVQGVDGVVTRVAQPVRQLAGELRVNQEVQIRTGSVRLT
jgi:hypothetical protein